MIIARQARLRRLLLYHGRDTSYLWEALHRLKGGEGDDRLTAEQRAGGTLDNEEQDDE